MWTLTVASVNAALARNHLVGVPFDKTIEDVDFSLRQRGSFALHRKALSGT
jgi:hypothetical protein